MVILQGYVTLLCFSTQVSEVSLRVGSSDLSALLEYMLYRSRLVHFFLPLVGGSNVGINPKLAFIG